MYTIPQSRKSLRNLKWTSAPFLFQLSISVIRLLTHFLTRCRCVPLLLLSARCYSYIHIHRFTILFSSIKYISHKYTRNGARTHTNTHKWSITWPKKSQNSRQTHTRTHCCTHGNICIVFIHVRYTHLRTRETVGSTLLITVLWMETTTTMNWNVLIEYGSDKIKYATFDLYTHEPTTTARLGMAQSLPIF